MIDIKIDDTQLQRRLDEILAGVTNLTPLLGDIGQSLIEHTRTNIAVGHDWQGRPFAPNTAVTLAKKRGNKPLINTGNFLAYRLDYHVSGASAVTIGSSAVQSAVLQFGARQGQFGRSKRNGPLPWGRIPPRPYLPLNDAGTDLVPQAREEVNTIIEEYLDSFAGDAR